MMVRNPVNLRAGPGTGYETLGEALGGQRYRVLARDGAGDWWQIDVDGAAAWVYGPLISLEGDAASVPVVEQVPAATPAASVQVYQTTISIPSYPYDAFTVEAFNPDYNWTYRRFDRAAYEASNPQPIPRTYEMVVLENDYLRVTVLPDLGGRIYQVVFKPTGNNELYQNPVIKPSPWGPVEQGWWLAAGGLECGLPVEEHGYASGDPWGHITTPFGQSSAGVTVFMPYADHVRAEVDVALRAGEAAFTIRPRISNPTDQPAPYKFWLDAMAAPGPANQPGAQWRFLFPTEQVTVHSTGDDALPTPGQPMSWPVYQGRDYGLLGNWDDFLGFFERPAAHGSFAGVYDEAADEGIVRVFAPSAVPGSKGFGLGWANPIDPANYTDDGSGYVELHAGVSPTFWDQATLAPGDTYSWEETWFPVHGIGGVSYADGNGAVHVAAAAGGLDVGVFPIQQVDGRVQVTFDGQPLLDEPADVSPAQPFRRLLPTGGLPTKGRIAVTLLDQSQAAVLSHQQDLTLP